MNYDSRLIFRWLELKTYYIYFTLVVKFCHFTQARLGPVQIFRLIYSKPVSMWAKVIFYSITFLFFFLRTNKKQLNKIYGHYLSLTKNLKHRYRYTISFLTFLQPPRSTQLSTNVKVIERHVSPHVNRRITVSPSQIAFLYLTT